jgi:hypothetical protein
VAGLLDPREDVAAFSAQVLKQDLWDHQADAAKSEAFITSIAAARRTGKTELGETLAIWTAMRERNVIVLILSATQDAARRLTESIAAKLNANRLTRGAVVDDFATRITLSNNSRIISLPASQRQVRGYGKGVRLVILDEAGFMPEELWAAAHYTALDERPQSRILMLGTPWGGPEHFFRRSFMAGQEGDPDHSSFHWTYEVNPRLDRAYLERQRDRVSPAEYAAEVLGEWSDAIGSLFPRDLLDLHTADVVLPQLDELRPPARAIVGVDWGVSYDRSAAVVLYRLPVADLNPAAPTLPRFVAIAYVWPAGALLGSVVDDLAVVRSCFRIVSTETNGVGAYPSQELVRRVRGSGDKRQWNEVFTTAAKKTAAYGCILNLLERGQLVLPRHPDLLRQLAGLRFEQGERGFTHIEAEDAATHDDVADALMLAALPHSPPGSRRIRCHLAALADVRKAPPDADVPELDEPIVETGGGLRVYRRPPLQSVTGRDITVTASVKQPELARMGRFTIKGGL